MSLVRAVLSASIALSLNACGDRPEHTSQYYEQHTQEAEARTKLCERLKMAERSAECVNAQNGEISSALHGRGEINPWVR